MQYEENIYQSLIHFLFFGKFWFAIGSHVLLCAYLRSILNHSIRAFVFREVFSNLKRRFHRKHKDLVISDRDLLQFSVISFSFSLHHILFILRLVKLFSDISTVSFLISIYHGVMCETGVSSWMHNRFVRKIRCGCEIMNTDLTVIGRISYKMRKLSEMLRNFESNRHAERTLTFVVGVKKMSLYLLV